MTNRELINELKADFRAYMNGVASAAMRNAGMTADYRVNFGVELPRITDVKNELEQRLDSDSGADEMFRARLAQDLWHEAVRECRIIALMLYPKQRMYIDLADVWAEDIRTVELAQMAALYLFSKMPLASVATFRWIAGEDEMKQVIGFYTVFHLVRDGQLAERSRDELSDQADAAATSENPQLAAAAMKVKGLL